MTSSYSSNICWISCNLEPEIILDKPAWPLRIHSHWAIAFAFTFAIAISLTNAWMLLSPISTLSDSKHQRKNRDRKPYKTYHFHLINKMQTFFPLLGFSSCWCYHFVLAEVTITNDVSFNKKLWWIQPQRHNQAILQP